MRRPVEEASGKAHGLSAAICNQIRNLQNANSIMPNHNIQ